MTKHLLVWVVAMMLTLAALQTRAAPTPAPADTAVDRLTGAMTAVDSLTLQTAEGFRIVLWGLRAVPPSSVPFNLKALDLLDRLIGGETVSCRIVSGAAPNLVARCATQNNADLGLELLSNGYAVVDRAQALGSVFGATYMKAQDTARAEEKGVWRLLRNEEREARLPKGFLPLLPLLVPFALIAGPLAGLLIALVMVRHWLRQARATQTAEIERSQRKEEALRARERHILMSALEGELVENKNRAMAFLLIYRDMLSALQNPNEVPKYQRVGDIVQKQPAMSKRVFEASVGKLSLLDIKMSGQLSKLYASLPEEREYINIDPEMPIAQVMETVEETIQGAESILAALEKSIEALAAARAEAVEISEV